MAKWIICCGMPRSGSTLQYQIAKGIVESANLGEGLGYFEQEQLFDVLNKMKEKPGHYVIKTHTFFEIPEGFNRDDFSFIYSYRDIRDVIVSSMKKANQNFKQGYNKEHYRALLSQHYRWIATPDMFISRYEEFSINIEQSILGISDYLKITVEKEMVDNLKQDLQLDNQLKKIIKFNSTKHHNLEYDNDTLLHRNHISSGKIKSWINELSEFEIAQIQKDFKKYLKENNYEIHKSFYSIDIFYFIVLFFKKFIFSKALHYAFKIFKK